MNFTPISHNSTSARIGMFTKSPDKNYDLQEMAELAERFRNAHARLNDIELRLHGALISSDRQLLLQNLEEARIDYSDARFAISTRSIISSR